MLMLSDPNPGVHKIGGHSTNKPDYAHITAPSVGNVVSLLEGIKE